MTKEIRDKIVEKIESLVKTYPSHLIDESLIKNKIIEILIDNIENPFNIENLQSEKKYENAKGKRCDIFFRLNNNNIFLELKLNRLVLKYYENRITGINKFPGDIKGILKDVNKLQKINNGKKYLFLLMQNKGVTIGNNYCKSLNEYCDENITDESKKLMKIIGNDDKKNVEVKKDEIIFGQVNKNEIPFRVLIFKVK